MRVNWIEFCMRSDNWRYLRPYIASAHIARMGASSDIFWCNGSSAVLPCSHLLPLLDLERMLTFIALVVAEVLSHCAVVYRGDCALLDISHPYG